MHQTPSFHARLIVIVATIALLGSSTFAYAQWPWPQPQQGTQSGFALSYAYTGSANGFRLEYSHDDYLLDAGWFDDSDGDIYCVELGWDPSSAIGEYGGVPFMLGVGGYQLSASTPGVDDSTSFNIWAGIGDFDHSSKGLFFQYRHIFGGVLSGSQGIVGWAF